MSFDHNGASLNPRTRELLLLDLNGLCGSGGGTMFLAPNEMRLIENRRNC